MGSASCLFILYRTAAISLFDPVVTSHKVRSVTGFISQRPENNRRMIFKSLHHPLISFEVSLGISRFLGQCPFAIPHSMRFDIGFTHDIQPIFVTKVIPFGIVRIMTRPHGIQIILLHHPYILDQSLPGYLISGQRIQFMAVGSFKQDRLPIDPYLPQFFLQFDFPESDPLRNNFQHFSGIIF